MSCPSQQDTGGKRRHPGERRSRERPFTMFERQALKCFQILKEVFEPTKTKRGFVKGPY